MKKNIALLIAVFIIVVLAGVILVLIPSNKAIAPTKTGSETASTTPSSQTAGIADLISVSAPRVNASVSSPLAVSGSARGTWYFEATFPIVLQDASGSTIAQGHGQAQGEWTTTDFVPFTASLSFPAQAPGSHGTLILKKDNPSGDPARDQSVSIPVTF
ncbi:MAG TPA: Gmad2 immunoglobulin-like domain-containing protein [Candidatus Paceibacterota bacterium]|nr:Gmad2 immunoglobulin-like domain-containing protein [Candidatus Paceibacterota bacterium]